MTSKQRVAGQDASKASGQPAHAVPQTALVSPGNWEALKGSVTGLDAAAQGGQRAAVQPTIIGYAGINIIDASANYGDVLHILGGNGLRMMTLQEVLFAAAKSQEFAERLKGRELYVDGEGPDKQDYYTIQPDGRLKKDISLKKDDGLYCVPGKGPLLLSVRSDKDSGFGGSRFILVTPNSIESVRQLLIVGVPENVPINSMCKMFERV